MTQSEKGKFIPFCFPNILVDEKDLVNSESSDFEGLKSSKKAVHIQSMQEVGAREEGPAGPSKKAREEVESTPRRPQKQKPFEKVLPNGGEELRLGVSLEGPGRGASEKQSRLKTRPRWRLLM